MKTIFIVLTLLYLQSNVLADSRSGVNYEQSILDTIYEIQTQKPEQALVSTRKLIKQYPQSRLGQMLYADILLAKTEPLTHIGSGITVDRALKDFKLEMRQRWRHDSDNSHQGMFPQSILFLAKNQPYIILVDQEKSRIYVYRNEKGIPILEADYFITIGLKGYGKQKQGDQKTPIGIYHVTRYIDDDELPDLYGSGAFPISYPNVWDVRKKRTGGGIWIHGTPSYTYNRSPWASNGCIAVSNPDFVDMDQYISPEFNTPVVVAKSLKWLTHQQWQQQRNKMLQVLDNWIADWESLSHERYRKHYSHNEFFAYGRDFNNWDQHKRWVNQNKSRVEVNYKDLNIFNYPGEENLVLMQYNQEYRSNNFNLSSPKEIYWRYSKDRWQIVYEGARTFPRVGTEIVQNQVP